jgi:hypothetical protein
MVSKCVAASGQEKTFAKVLALGIVNRLPILLTANLLALNGCVFLTFGDGAFRISGSITPAAQSCEVALFTESGTEMQFTRRKVRGEFHDDFTVAPSSSTYIVSVFCDGILRKSMTVRYGSETKAGQLVSLGEIAF